MINRLQIEIDTNGGKLVMRVRNLELAETVTNDDEMQIYVTQGHFLIFF